MLLTALAAVPAIAQTPARPDSALRPNAAERRAQAGNLVGHGGPIKAITIAPASGKILTGAFDYAMTAWDDDAGIIRAVRMDDHQGAINATAFARSSATGTGEALALAAGDDAALTVWSLSTAHKVHTFTGHTGKIVGLAVSPSGTIAATASWDRTARLWDLATLQPGAVLEGHTGPVNAAAFSSDGRRVFTASADGNVRAFDAATGKLDRAIYAHGWGINVLLRLPGTDHLLLGAVNGSAMIIDTATGDRVRDLPAHARPVLAIAALDKPGLIATGGGDGIIRVLRTGDGAHVAEYKNPYGPVWALAFSAGGQSLYYGGLDDFATLWNFTPQTAVGPADAPAPRRFQMQATSTDQLAQGEQQFARKCSVCHTLTPEGGNRAGPSLHGIFGRRIATLPGYPFSEPLRRMELVWSEETVAKLFELGPDVVTPGSKMPLQQMTDKTQRDALIAYLKIATAATVPPAEKKQ